MKTIDNKELIMAMDELEKERGITNKPSNGWLKKLNINATPHQEAVDGSSLMT